MADRLPRIFVAGDRGLAGSAILRRLREAGHCEIVTCHRRELDLCRQSQVESFFRQERIDQVYFAAGKVGGIFANNTYPAEFILENLLMACNVIHAAHQADVQRFLFLGSSCIYPKHAPQPIREESLLSGPLEPTNEPYAVAKIAGIKLCESYNRQYGRDYRSLMPTNLYGPNDNYHPQNAHVIPSLLRRFHEARLAGAPEVVVWGSGTPRREFLHVDDLATACIHVMSLDAAVYQAHTRPMLSHVNVGTGRDCTIRELVETVVRVVGYGGDVRFDTGKPDGPPRKLLDVSLMHALGWKSTIPLEEGLRNAYHWFLTHQGEVRE